MERLEALVAALPEATRVNVEAWDNAPTFRVRNKNFVFANDQATHLSFKLDREEARAVVASDPAATAMGYGVRVCPTRLVGERHLLQPVQQR